MESHVVKNVTKKKTYIKELSYDELVELVKGMQTHLTRFDIVTYLINYNNIISRDDYDNIIRLYVNGIISD